MTNWSKVSLGLGSGLPGAGRSSAVGSSGRAREERAPASAVHSGDEAELGVLSQDELDAGLEQTAEAVVYPAAGVRRRLHEQQISGELDRAQRCKPDAVRGLVDSKGELSLHPRPYVLELGAHGSVCPLLSPRK
jgi:hypothetical protein